MRLYDTARQEVATFEPGAGRGGTVTMYTCGITPYDAAHLGHAATYLAYDVLQRRLLDLGYKTRLVRNVTDVDDDMLRKARQIGVYYLDLAAEEMAIFSADMEALGLLPAASEPRATSAIPDILGFIGMVLANGHAYQAGGAVYFSVSSWPEFGAVSHYSSEKMLELARERGGNPDDPHKSDPLDFVLWQPSAPDEPAWTSMRGPGRPGWHIECSALALRELGTTIDLHGGGSDLVFPHHECETAQSEAATGERFVRHWVHTGMVRYEGAKMSKSLGNLVFVRDSIENLGSCRHPPGGAGAPLPVRLGLARPVAPGSRHKAFSVAGGHCELSGCRAGCPGRLHCAGHSGRGAGRGTRRRSTTTSTPLGRWRRSMRRLGQGNVETPGVRADLENGPTQAIKEAAVLLGVQL